MTGEQWPAHIPWGQQKDMVSPMVSPMKTHGKTHENHGKTHEHPWKKPISFTGRSHGLSISFSDVGAAELGRKALQLVCRQRDSANLWEFWTSKGRFTFPGWFSIVSLLLRRNLPSTPPNFSAGVFYPLPAFFPWSFMVFFYTFSSTHNYHSYVKSQASQASRWSPWLPIRGFPQIGGYPQKNIHF